MDTPQQYPTMWTTGYIGNVKVSFTFPIRNELEAYAQAKTITDKLIADGFTLHEPGLEAGEVKEQVGFVSRRQKKNDDQTITPIIDVYAVNDAMKFKFISVYLNTPEDVTAFENASGLKVSRLPLVPGKAALDKSDDSGGVVKVAQVMHIVMKPNPYFDPDEKDIQKMKPKNTFIRWEAATPAPQPSQPSQPATPPAAASEPDYAALEIEARKKAVTALDNEAVTIYKVTYNPTHNGMGAPSWTALAHDGNGTSLPITVGERGAALVKKAGWDWPTTDGDGLAIDVITEMSGKNRHIKSVLALDGSWVAEPVKTAEKPSSEANSGNSKYVPNWTVIYGKVKSLYDNPKHMGNSVQALYREGAFANCRNDADAINVIIQHKKGFAEGTPA